MKVSKFITIELCEWDAKQLKIALEQWHEKEMEEAKTRLCTLSDRDPEPIVKKLLAYL